MNWKTEWKKLVLIIAVFIACFYMPTESGRFNSAVSESLALVKDYARQHVLLCLIPAFFIAGAVAVFVSRDSVMKYLGPNANKVLAYSVASISGSILAVCSCTVLPLFAGIYRMGAGLGPATAFLYSGPAINVLAIILTARILGLEMGIARAVGAIIFSIVIGLSMHLIYRRREMEKAEAQINIPTAQVARPLWKTTLHFVAMVGILVFANWARSGDVRAVFLCCPGGLSTYNVEGKIVQKGDDSLTILDTSGTEHRVSSDLLIKTQQIKKNNLYEWIYRLRWIIVLFLAAVFLLMLLNWFTREETFEWIGSSWDFAKQILPLLFVGVLIAGFLLGRPGREALIPARWVNAAVGGNSVRANLFASIAGAFMYFATLTEVPILHGLMGAGMGKGPALALLLAGPALSLPNMLVIRSVIGTQKTAVYVFLVVVMATISGVIFGAFF
jgi:uncharacterized membrane protein YraQ (UPF0718 family)